MSPNYPLTDRLQFDILQSGPGWRGPNAIRSTKTAPVHHCSAAWPLATRAQQPERMRRIGVLTSFASDDLAEQTRVLAFAQAVAAAKAGGASSKEKISE